jgi:hypothetical protein
MNEDEAIVWLSLFAAYRELVVMTGQPKLAFAYMYK